MSEKRSIQEIKSGIEAILFMSPKFISIKKVYKFFPEAEKEVIDIIISDLIIEYDNKNSSIKIIRDNENIEMLLKPEYSKYSVFAVGKQLTKSELNTLALIALNSPVYQYKITKKRPTEHLNTLKDLGLIQIEKKGRRNLLSVTKKFNVLFNKKTKIENLNLNV